MPRQHGYVRFFEKRRADERRGAHGRRPQNADVKLALEQLADLILAAGFGKHTADGGILPSKRLHQRR